MRDELRIGILLMIVTFLVILGIFLMNQDCEKNPPLALSCSSNNFIDDGLKDCILLEHKDIGFLGWGSHNQIYSCEKNGQRIEIEKRETNCNYSPSNLTADYRFCRGFN